MASRRTRHKSSDASRSVGGASHLSEAELPLLKEIFARAHQIKNSSPKIVRKDLIDILYAEVVNVYRKVNSNLPLISEKRAKQKLKKSYETYKNLIKGQASSSHPRMISFQSKLDKIFDIISCKCDIQSCNAVSCEGCDKKAHIICKCSKDKKIPVKELAFILDQRQRCGSKGSYHMCTLDKKEVERMEKNFQKKNRKTNIDNVSGAELLNLSQDYIAVENDETDIDFVAEDFHKNVKNSTVSQNRVTVKNSAKECVRWGLSARGGAAIITAALADYGLVSRDDMSLAVDKNKLRRAIQSYENELKEDQILELKVEKPKALWFDGKKDDTLFVETDAEGKKKNVIKKKSMCQLLVNLGENM